jgi:hypothetical protein
MKSHSLVLIVALVLCSVLFGKLPARAQEAIPQSGEEVCPGCTFRPMWFPFIKGIIVGSPKRLVSAPVGVEYYFVREENVVLADCYTHPDGHCRVWVEIDPSIVELSDVFTLLYDFDDGETPSFTYLPDAECGDSCPPASWIWQVVDNNGINLNDLTKHMRDIGQISSAMKLEELRTRQATVVIIQLNRRWNLRWGVPVYESGPASVYGHEQQFVAELFRQGRNNPCHAEREPVALQFYLYFYFIH